MSGSTLLVQCRDNNGGLYKLQVTARTAAEARGKAAGDGHNVEWVEGEGALNGARAAANAFKPGAMYGKVADLMAVVGIVLWPLALIGLVMGTVAYERSEGRYGRTAIAIGKWYLIIIAALIAAWIVLMVIVAVYSATSRY